MYVLNFIAVIVCFIAAVVQGIKGNVGWCVLESMLLLTNLPYAIEWFKETFEK